MDHITKPSVTRLARRAGVKSMTDDCYPQLFDAIETIVKSVMATAVVVSMERGTQTIMSEDVYEGLALRGINVARSTNLSTKTCGVKR